jgi:hypothetical protein
MVVVLVMFMVTLVTHTGRQRVWAAVETPFGRGGRHVMSKIWMKFAVVAALGFGVTACGDKTPAEKAPDAGKSAGETVGDATEATGEAVGNAAKTTGEAVGDATKATGEFVGDAAKATGGAVGDATKATGEFVGDAAKATGGAVGDATKATGEFVGDAARATGEFLRESKDASVKAAQNTLDGIEKKWQELQANAAPASDEAKADLQKTKDVMAQALADAQAKCVEAKDASADVWQKNVKPALDAAVLKAQKLYDDAAAKFASN